MADKVSRCAVTAPVATRSLPAVTSPLAATRSKAEPAGLRTNRSPALTTSACGSLAPNAVIALVDRPPSAATLPLVTRPAPAIVVVRPKASRKTPVLADSEPLHWMSTTPSGRSETQSAPLASRRSTGWPSTCSAERNSLRVVPSPNNVLPATVRLPSRLGSRVSPMRTNTPKADEEVPTRIATTPAGCPATGLSRLHVLPKPSMCVGSMGSETPESAPMRARIGPITAPSLSLLPLRIGPARTIWPSMLHAAATQPTGTRLKAIV